MTASVVVSKTVSRCCAALTHCSGRCFLLWHGSIDHTKAARTDEELCFETGDDAVAQSCDRPRDSDEGEPLLDCFPVRD